MGATLLTNSSTRFDYKIIFRRKQRVSPAWNASRGHPFQRDSKCWFCQTRSRKKHSHQRKQDLKRKLRQKLRVRELILVKKIGVSKNRLLLGNEELATSLLIPGLLIGVISICNYSYKFIILSSIVKYITFFVWV